MYSKQSKGLYSYLDMLFFVNILRGKFETIPPWFYDN